MDAFAVVASYYDTGRLKGARIEPVRAGSTRQKIDISEGDKVMLWYSLLSLTDSCTAPCERESEPLVYKPVPTTPRPTLIPKPAGAAIAAQPMSDLNSKYSMSDKNNNVIQSMKHYSNSKVSSDLHITPNGESWLETLGGDPNEAAVIV